MSRLDPRPPPPGPGHLDSVWGGVGGPVVSPTPWGVSGVFYCLIRADTASSASTEGLPAPDRMAGFGARAASGREPTCARQSVLTGCSDVQ